MRERGQEQDSEALSVIGRLDHGNAAPVPAMPGFPERYHKAEANSDEKSSSSSAPPRPCLPVRPGIRPRASASDYPAQQSGAGVTLGAAIVPPDQVKKLFAVDLNKLGYTVVEMAVYPDRDVEIAARDFLLRADQRRQRPLRPVAPSTIAGALEKTRRLRSRRNCPGLCRCTAARRSATGRVVRRTPAGGVYTESTVGVGVGDPRVNTATSSARAPGRTKDSLSVQVELEKRALPEGRFDHPVAGYLYFPVRAEEGAARTHVVRSGRAASPRAASHKVARGPAAARQFAARRHIRRAHDDYRLDNAASSSAAGAARAIRRQQQHVRSRCPETPPPSRR